MKTATEIDPANAFLILTNTGPRRAAARYTTTTMTKDTGNRMKTTTSASKLEIEDYYTNPILNRLANERKWGRVFGEKTMLDMMGECCDEAQFIEMIEEQF